MSTSSPEKTHHHLGEDVDHAGHVDTGLMSRRWIYIGAVVVLVGMLVAGLVSWSNIKATNEATNKANQLKNALAAANLPVPTTDQIIRVLGTDGGAVCADPATALRNGIDRVGLTNGAAGPGQRPTIGAARVVDAERIVLQTYCPGKVDDFNDQVRHLKFDDVVRS